MTAMTKLALAAHAALALSPLPVGCAEGAGSASGDGLTGATTYITDEDGLDDGPSMPSQPQMILEAPGLPYDLGGAWCGNATGDAVLTGEDGRATCDLVLGEATGTVSIQAVVGGSRIFPSVGAMTVVVEP